MPQLSRNALSAAMVRSAGPGNYVDGNGLMLRVRKSGTRQWIQRLMIHGRRVDLGLGSAELVKLADARRVAADNRAIARTGDDPRRSRVPTFEKAEKICFAEKRDTWRSKSPANNWRSAMDRYVLPRFGGMPVDRVGSAAIYEVLRPIALAGKHTPPSRWPGRRSRRCWSGRESRSLARKARRWRRCGANCRNGRAVPSTTTPCTSPR